MRPLLQVNNPVKKLKDLFNVRKGMYAKTAHVIFSTEKKSIKNILNKILRN